jgi:hypothetical protein
MELEISMHNKFFICSATAILAVVLTFWAKPASAQDDDATFDTQLNATLTQVAKSLDGKTGKVAVMDFPSLEGNINGLSSYIANRAGNQLINSNKEVVDRNVLAKVIKELKLQQSALMDSKTAAKVGRLAGAKFFLLGNFTRLPRAMSITVRVLNVETAQFVGAQEVSIPMTGANTELVNSLMKMSGTEVPTTNLDATADSSGAAAPAATASPTTTDKAGK